MMAEMSDPALDPVELVGRRRALAWYAVWLVFLGYPIADIVSRRRPVAPTVAAVAALVAFALLYLATLSSATSVVGDPRRSARAVRLVAFYALAFASVAAFGRAWGGILIYVGVATGSTLAVGPALVGLGVLDGMTVALGVVVGATWSDVAFDCFLATALGATMLGIRRLVQAIVELRVARDEIARLSTDGERLRIARDLHDVLGHNLSAISLQAQLARRYLGVDPAEADATLCRLELVARQSLSDVRRLVAGYRPRALVDELAAAAELLAAAGIAADVGVAPGLPDATTEVLAWAVREATTNVIRHSKASLCTITVTAGPGGQARLVVSDDGVGEGHPQPNTDADCPAAGSGLRGLHERVAVVGGGAPAEHLPLGRAGPRPTTR